MTHLLKASLILACVVTLCGLGQGRALAAEAECESNTNQVKALSSGSHHTEVNFNTDVNGVPDAVGHFDPAPLLSTTIAVDGGRNQISCLIAHLSVEVAPLDNHVMFQVLARTRDPCSPLERQVKRSYAVATAMQAWRRRPRPGLFDVGEQINGPESGLPAGDRLSTFVKHCATREE